jgi:hypothetical protein
MYEIYTKSADIVYYSIHTHISILIRKCSVPKAIPRISRIHFGKYLYSYNIWCMN